MDNLNQPKASQPDVPPRQGGIRWTTVLWLLLIVLMISWFLPSFTVFAADAQSA